MKSLDITNNQKLMILEMTKKLFPEFDKFWFLKEDYCGNETCRIVLANIYKENTIIGTQHINKGCTKGIPTSIHWFEFCMTHLARKIFNSGQVFDNPVSDSVDGLSEMVWRQEWYRNYHPVEYLYEQFKKIK